ncbi:MarR family winged helix-turn-helix transcriptional regulator [Streptomyces chiangmaiensis]|uniref:MarR family transcriptional regulator n=1 Tax=Streptomyces chiangmaiensis TaxID=766497 RepID=A0ABU7FT11_9ACTN|nr:MarR family transcriptional regulator [Streptomyces chiangmaiensis]MED7826973.1 MarR family transcriptional regulator [Streptomyces chiangmaiensis]
MNDIKAGVEEKDEASLLLDDQLCFALYAAQRALTNRYRPLLEEFNLTYPQYLVMLVLWEHRALPIKTLGRHLQLDYGTLTPLLKRLEAHGLIRRERQVNDERSVQVTLTEQGAELRERARVVPGAIAGIVGLTAQEVQDAKSLLERLTANIAEGD